MEISDIIMETFTLGTAIGLNMTHNASFCAERKRCRVEQTERGWLKLSLVVYVSAGA